MIIIIFIILNSFKSEKNYPNLPYPTSLINFFTILWIFSINPIKLDLLQLPHPY